MTTIDLVDGIRYGFRLFGYALGVLLVAGAATAGGAYLLSDAVNVSPLDVVSSGRLAAGAILSLAGVVGLWVGTAAVAHKFVADSVAAGIEAAGLATPEVAPEPAAAVEVETTDGTEPDGEATPDSGAAATGEPADADPAAERGPRPTGEEPPVEASEAGGQGSEGQSEMPAEGRSWEEVKADSDAVTADANDADPSGDSGASMWEDGTIETEAPDADELIDGAVDDPVPRESADDADPGDRGGAEGADDPLAAGEHGGEAPDPAGTSPEEASEAVEDLYADDVASGDGDAGADAPVEDGAADEPPDDPGDAVEIEDTTDEPGDWAPIDPEDLEDE